LFLGLKLGCTSVKHSSHWSMWYILVVVTTDQRLTKYSYHTKSLMRITRELNKESPMYSYTTIHECTCIVYEFNISTLWKWHISLYYLSSIFYNLLFHMTGDVTLCYMSCDHSYIPPIVTYLFITQKKENKKSN